MAFKPQGVVSCVIDP